MIAPKLNWYRLIVLRKWNGLFFRLLFQLLLQCSFSISFKCANIFHFEGTVKLNYACSALTIRNKFVVLFFFVKNSIDSAWNATLVYYVNIGIFSFNYLRDGTKRIKYLESYLWFMYFNLIKIIFMLKFFNDLRSVVNKLLRLCCQSVCVIKLLYSFYFLWKSRGSFIKAKVVYVELSSK